MKIAMKWMTPVLLLTDGYLGNGSEPFRVPDASELPKVEPKYQTTPNYADGAVHAVPARREAHPSRGPSPARRASSTASAASRRTRSRAWCRTTA